MKPAKKDVERVANAIKFMVPLCGGDAVLHGDHVGNWTIKGLLTVKWPKNFSRDERKVIRLIARTAISCLRKNGR
jgi:hypothetical protein